MMYDYQRGSMDQISQSDEQWLDDAFFKGQQAALPIDAPRAALTYRVSTKGQVDHDDIPMQKIACRKFAQEHGWRVVMEEAEKGVSGSKVSAEKRDIIQKMKNEALDGSFDILLVYMFDRLGRIESETPFVLEWFVKHGIEMWSTREGQQRIESHCDKLMNYIRFWQASGESEKTSIRTRDRLRQIVSSGHYAGGFVPYGYHLVDKGRVNKRDQPVKDLEIDPDEAEWVREVFEKVAREGISGYAMAHILNDRGIRTRQGAKFQSNNINRLIRHEGYTGYIITKGARSEHIPELQIIDENLFREANEMLARRSLKMEAEKRTAQKYNNPVLLAGMVFCAHCGKKMSAFVHTDRYKLRNGTVREKTQPKYNCFQRAQGFVECDGQSLYLAERVDAAVLEVVYAIFKTIRETPYDKSIEQRIRMEEAGRHKERVRIEKKIKAAEHQKERFEEEIIRVLDGNSAWSQETLSRMLKKAENDLEMARQEMARFLASNRDHDTVRKIKAYYSEFLGWTNEFELATVPQKRTILRKLIDKIELGKGYQITIHLNMSYAQFLDCGADIQNTQKAG